MCEKMRCRAITIKLKDINMKYRIAIIFTLLAISGAAIGLGFPDHSHDEISIDIPSEHSGGTDKNGCHAGTQPYHCH